MVGRSVGSCVSLKGAIKAEVLCLYLHNDNSIYTLRISEELSPANNPLSLAPFSSYSEPPAMCSQGISRFFKQLNQLLSFGIYMFFFPPISVLDSSVIYASKTSQQAYF